MSIVSVGVAVNPMLNGMVTGAGVKSSGDSVTLTAIPYAKKYFKAWTLPNGTVSTSNPLTFTAATSGTWIANFERLLSVRVPSVQGGTATGENYAVKVGDTITLGATPISGFSFIGWYINGNKVSTATSYAFVASTNLVVTPIFQNTEAGGTVITTSTPVLNTLCTAVAVTGSWVEVGEIKTSGVRRAVFYIDITHTNSANVRIKFLAKTASGGTGYSFVDITPAAGVNAVDEQYFELNTDATQSIMLELLLNEDVAFLGVNIEAGTVGATADTVTIKYGSHQ